MTKPMIDGNGIISNPIKEDNKIQINYITHGEEIKSYNIDKRQDFLPAFFQLLLNIGFDNDSTSLVYYFAVPRKENEATNEEYYKDPFSQEYLNIKIFDETIIFIDNNEYDIELIFFKKSISINLRASDDNIIRFGREISKITKFGN